MRIFLPFITALFILAPYMSQAQCTMVELPLSLRIGEADAVFEGRIEGSRFESINGSIYTIYMVDIFKLFKGDIKNSKAEIVAPGGYMNGKVQHIEPNFHGSYGQTGIFTVTYRPDLLNETTHDRFYAFAADQSAITYNEEQGYGSDVFHRYHNIEQELYTPIHKHLGKEAKIVHPFNATSFISIPKYDNTQQATAEIYTVSPLTVRGGIGDTIKINGNGFGTFRNRAKIQFRNADDGGQTWITPPSSDVIKWTGNEIWVKVPGGNWFTLSSGFNGAAGSGQLLITPESGPAVQTSQSITIRHSINARTLQTNQTNPPVFETFFPYLIDHNGLGGYTFRPSNSYKANNAAVDVFKRSLQTWRCGTRINFSYSDMVSTANCAKEDNINTIAMSSAGCPMPFQGVLAYTNSVWINQPCVGNDEKQYYTIMEIDLVVNKDINWNFTTDTIKNGKYDLQAVLTHELGHAHQLGHVIDSKKIMHYAIGPNSFPRKLNLTSDIFGGNQVIDTSMDLRCSAIEKTYRIKQDECDINHPKAHFILEEESMIEGCAPLTVRFKNLSVNTPENYLWDTDGNGVNDEYIENPTKTFSQPGKYSVRLIVWRDDAIDTLIRKDYITVFESPTVATIPVYSICKDSAVIIGGKDIVSTGIQPYTYSWTPNTDIVTGRLTSSPTVKPAKTTQYIVAVRDGSGCIGRDTVTVNVVENIRPKISRNGDTLLINEEGAIQWFADGIAIENAKSGKYVPKKSGNYTVRITNTAGCTALSDPINVTISTIEEIISDQNTNIRFNTKNNTLALHGIVRADYELYSVLGTVLYQGSISADPTIMDMNSYPAGVYFIRIKNNNQAQIYSFIKH